MSLEQLWRARLVWAGLCFVYARACVLAVLGGRTGKPRYRVTRKENSFAWHWQQIVPHVLLLGVLFGSMAFSLAEHGLLSSFDVGSAYWAVLYGLLMIGFIRLSWHGLDLRPRARQGHARRRAPARGEWLAPIAASPPAARGIAPRSLEAVRALEAHIGEWGRPIEDPGSERMVPEAVPVAAPAVAEP
jgi:hypothetical protein